MTTLTLAQANLYKFVSDDTNREFSSVFISPDRIVATDSFSLALVSGGAPAVETPVLVASDEMETAVKVAKAAKRETVSIENTKSPDGYPNIQTALDDVSGEPVAKVSLNVKYLKNMIDYLAKHHASDGMKSIDLSIFSTNQPIKIEAKLTDNQNFTGLIMPIKS